MGFLRAVGLSVVYGTLLIVLLLAGWIGYIYFFMATTPPSDSAWASYTIDSTGFSFEFVKTNGVSLNVITAGPKTGRAVVFLHGFPETALIGWHYHIRHFAQLGYYVIAPDQRGYNTSAKPASIGDYNIDALATDIAGLFDFYGQDKVILVGHDWGAAVAFRVAMLFPSRIEKMAILNVPHPLVMQQYLRSNLGQVQKSWYIFFFQIPYIPELKFAKDDYLFGRVAIANSGIPGVSFSRDSTARLVQAWSEPGALTGMINWYRAILQRKDLVRQDVDPIIQPETLILWGKNDTALSFAMAETTQKEFLRDGKLVPLDATHWVQHDKPEEVASLLGQFFEGK